MRKICVAYWLLLTLLLWSRDPLDWFDTSSVDAVHSRLEPISHFLSFGLLTLIVFWTPWRVPRGRLLLILAGYSVATELVQAVIPGRSMSLVDLLQDFAGILAGAAVVALAQRFRAPQERADTATDSLQHPRRRQTHLASEPIVDSISS